MNFDEKVTLGTTGREVGRLGIASSYRAPQEAYEEAFERGCTYFTLGSFLMGKSAAMADAIWAIIAKGKRDELVLGMITYAHNALLTEVFLKKGLKALGADHADVLILGYYSKRPPRRVLDGAVKLKEQGLVRALGMTGTTAQCSPSWPGRQMCPSTSFTSATTPCTAAPRGTSFPTSRRTAVPASSRSPRRAGASSSTPRRCLKAKRRPLRATAIDSPSPTRPSTCA